MKRWLFAFVFTQLVEVPIYRRLLGATFLEAFGASAITHPSVWGVFMFWGRQAGFSYPARAISAELFAWLFEAAYLVVILRPKPARTRAIVVSLVANGASLGLGFLAYALFRWP